MKANATNSAPLWVLVVALAIGGSISLASGAVPLGVSQVCLAGYLGFLAQRRLRNSLNPKR